MRFKDRVVIVTGAGSGIGRGIAMQFAREGAVVIVGTLEEEEGERTVARIRDTGGEAHFLLLDVRLEDSVLHMTDTVLRTHGRIDVLVNNAGISWFKPLLEATADDWEHVVGTNLRGVFLCSKYAAAHMVKQRKGAIVNISSNHSIATLPNAEMYAASKGGVNAMTRSMAISLREHGVRVNAICPGFTRTEKFDRWLKAHPQAEEELYWLHSNGRFCTPEDIGKLAVYLASDDAEMVNGEEIVIDGGMSARLYNSRLI